MARIGSFNIGAVDYGFILKSYEQGVLEEAKRQEDRFQKEMKRIEAYEKELDPSKLDGIDQKVVIDLTSKWREKYNEYSELVVKGTNYEKRNELLTEANKERLKALNYIADARTAQSRRKHVTEIKTMYAKGSIEIDEEAFSDYFSKINKPVNEIDKDLLKVAPMEYLQFKPNDKLPESLDKAIKIIPQSKSVEYEKTDKGIVLRHTTSSAPPTAIYDAVKITVGGSPKNLKTAKYFYANNYAGKELLTENIKLNSLFLEHMNRPISNEIDYMAAMEISKNPPSKATVDRTQEYTQADLNQAKTLAQIDWYKAMMSQGREKIDMFKTREGKLDAFHALNLSIVVDAVKTNHKEDANLSTAQIIENLKKGKYGTNTINDITKQIKLILEGKGDLLKITN